MSDRINELIQQALQAVSPDEMMEVARELMSLKDPTRVNQVMKSVSDTPEGAEQMSKLRDCFLELLGF